MPPNPVLAFLQAAAEPVFVDGIRIVVEPGRTLLLYSDALPEAHDLAGEMFGFPRLVRVAGRAGDRVLDTLLTELARFTGLDWKQEDDITAVSLTRSRGDMHPAADGIAARGRSGSGGAGVGRQLVGRRS